MKKIAKLSVAVLCLSAITGLTYAAKPGTYVGAGLGESFMEKQKYGPNNVAMKNHNNGLAGRLFAGYNFNEYFGIESGLARYGNSTAKNNVILPSNGSNIWNSMETKLTTFDVVGKAYLPIQNSGFNLYGLAGLAYVHDVTETKQHIVTKSNMTLLNRSTSKTTNSVHPIYGVGASYDIPQTNFVTNLEYTRLQGSANPFGGKKAPNANMLTFNVAYNFD